VGALCNTIYAPVLHFCLQAIFTRTTPNVGVGVKKTEHREVELNPPVPELPVSDVEKAQKYYCDYLGCKVEWINAGKEIGAVSNGETAIFFRRRADVFEPVVHWIHCKDVDKSYRTLKARGANIVDDIEDKPWNLRQFTLLDLDGNVFYLHG